ncbi:MAG: glucose-1-phosphate adenylyltransferase [Candidatus Brocadiaceae bacterium]
MVEPSELRRDTLVMILAGGPGERLYPLTKDRAKPAVPFGGSYRIIDFTLSNCLNSGLRRVYVLTQYKSDSLNRHIRLGWDIFNPALDEYIEIRPPQQRMSSNWYLGTAHAIYQNIYTLEHQRPRYVLVLGGDHVYRMDYADMLMAHARAEADVTVACIEKPVEEAAGTLGVVTTDESMRVGSFVEKPDEPTPLPDRPESCLCSMGIYAFSTEPLVQRVIENAKAGGEHDFGRNVLPAMVEQGDRVFAYRYQGGYWRDIGTLDAYWDANMDLVSVQPLFNLYDEEWPLRSHSRSRPPAKVVFGGGAPEAPRAEVYNCLLGDGAIVSGAYVCDSIIGPDVRVEVGSRIDRSIILDQTVVGRGATIRKAIIDKYNVIPEGAELGVAAERDRRHFRISEGGVVVMPKGMPFPRS